MYLETMERIFGNTDKTIIDTGPQSGGPGVVPYLPLNCRRPSRRRRRPSRASAIGRQAMKPSLVGGVTAVVLLIAAIVGYSTFFTVYQTRQALVVRLGNPVRVITEPGLNVKVPFVDTVIYIDKRILNIEQPAQEVIASSRDSANAGAGQAGERLVVDAFARYRIVDPLKYYQTVGPAGASSQLAILLNSTLRSVLGAATLTDVVRNKREELMAKMRDQLDHDAQPFGIHVVDVRIRRADLPEQNSEAVYHRMQTERQREAAEFRAQGSQKATDDPRQGRSRRDRARRGRQSAVRADPRRGRRHAQPDLRRSL